MSSTNPSNVTIGGHILRESAISMLINIGFSLGYTYVVFRASEVITRPELITDALPQTFCVSFFASLVPTLLTRRKIRAGQIDTLPRRKWHTPGDALVRAIVIAMAAAILGVLLHALVLHLYGIESVSLATALVYKSIYGAALSWIITPFALWIALSDGLTLR